MLFEAEGSAYEAQSKLDGLKWPFEGGKKLTVAFCPPEALSDCHKGEASTPTTVEKKPDPVGNLDRLFKKTIAEPPLYYMPAALLHKE